MSSKFKQITSTEDCLELVQWVKLCECVDPGSIPNPGHYSFSFFLYVCVCACARVHV